MNSNIIVIISVYNARDMSYGEEVDAGVAPLDEDEVESIPGAAAEACKNMS